MDEKQAVKLLGLTNNEGIDEITVAFNTKLKLVEEKLSSAPTEALKQKLGQMKLALTQAHQVLTEQQTLNTPTKPSPLSQTKMADLPGIGSQSAAVSNIEIGSVLAGRYTIEAQIGVGGMGAVYQATDDNTGEPIAIKMLLPELLKNSRAQERFINEARISQKLSHPNIVNVYDVQQDGEMSFLTMELLEGQDLRKLMENRKLSRQEFDEAEAKEMLLALCGALTYAHKYTVHRDLKPENIWVTEDGDYKIMDFGIARIMSNSQRTQTGVAMGTAYYMAPEQLKGTSKLDGRADIYAIGVLMYELLTGDIPAGRIKPLRELRKDLSKGFAAAIDQTLEPKPDERFVDVLSFIKAFESHKSGYSISYLSNKKLLKVVAALIVVSSISALLINGNLNPIWDAIKPADKAAIVTQKAEMAKLEGQIINYKKRLNDGRNILKNEIKELKRNFSRTDPNLIKKMRWQQITDDFLFESDKLTELEGELSKGKSLLKEGSLELASKTLTLVRDSYKDLWNKFNMAEPLKGEESWIGVSFLKQNKSNSGVVTTSSGLQYKVLRKSKGNWLKPKSSDFVTVHYRGSFISGEVFDDSYARQQPATFPLNGVISGWTEGLQLMTVGSKYQFFIPSKLAYGEKKRGDIPGNSVLLFDIELLEIKP